MNSSGTDGRASEARALYVPSSMPGRLCTAPRPQCRSQFSRVCVFVRALPVFAGESLDPAVLTKNRHDLESREQHPTHLTHILQLLTCALQYRIGALYCCFPRPLQWGSAAMVAEAWGTSLTRSGTWAPNVAYFEPMYQTPNAGAPCVLVASAL